MLSVLRKMTNFHSLKRMYFFFFFINITIRKMQCYQRCNIDYSARYNFNRFEASLRDGARSKIFRNACDLTNDD